METNKTPLVYLKTDDNRIINERHIRWVKKMNDCLEVCTRSIGCGYTGDTHKICKSTSPDSYNILHKHFEKPE
jgi:hypothetical protein